MKIKILIALSLATMICFAGCKSTENTNTMNANMMTNANMMNSMPETATTDPMMGKKIEDALKAKGFNDLTVDTTTTPATLRGTYPKDKLPEVMQTASEAYGKPVQNAATGK